MKEPQRFRDLPGEAVPDSEDKTTAGERTIDMIIEQRTYTVAPAKMAKWLELYEKQGLPIQLRHLEGLAGFFRTEIGHINQVVHLWKYDNLQARMDRRAAMAKDPGWQTFLAANVELGAITEQASAVLLPLPWSPLK